MLVVRRESPARPAGVPARGDRRVTLYRNRDELLHAPYDRTFKTHPDPGLRSWNNIATHTINAAGDLTMVDAQTWRPNPAWR